MRLARWREICLHLRRSRHRLSHDLGRSVLLLLLLLQVIHVEGVCLVDLADEEGLVGQELLLVDHVLIQEHARDDTSNLIAKDSLDGWVNAITHEVLSVLSLDLVEV